MSALPEPLVRSYRLHGRLFDMAFQGFSVETALARPSPDANHAAFIGLHLLDARAWTASIMDGPPVSHPFAEGAARARAIDEMGTFPAPTELVAAWNDVSEELIRRLETLDEAALAADAGADFPLGDRSVHGALAFLVLHESYHLGQLGLLRKVVGLPPLDFSRAAIP